MAPSAVLVNQIALSAILDFMHPIISVFCVSPIFSVSMDSNTPVLHLHVTVLVEPVFVPVVQLGPMKWVHVFHVILDHIAQMEKIL